MGQLDKLLHKKVYLDSNIIIYLLEGYEPFEDFLNQFMQAIYKNEINCCTSQLSITEVCQGAIKKFEDYELIIYRDFFKDNDLIDIYTFTQNDFFRAAFLSAEQKLKTPDALHLAAAIANKCDIFLTNDKGFKPNPNIAVCYLSDL